LNVFTLSAADVKQQQALGLLFFLRKQPHKAGKNDSAKNPETKTIQIEKQEQ